MIAGFSAAHRGGSGPPMVCLHGFMDTWRTWELVLPALQRHHDVLAPTFAGHAGGPPFDAAAGQAGVVVAIWMVLPLLIGIYRITRREVTT